MCVSRTIRSIFKTIVANAFTWVPMMSLAFQEKDGLDSRASKFTKTNAESRERTVHGGGPGPDLM